MPGGESHPCQHKALRYTEQIIYVTVHFACCHGICLNVSTLGQDTLRTLLYQMQALLSSPLQLMRLCAPALVSSESGPKALPQAELHSPLLPMTGLLAEALDIALQVYFTFPSE